MLRKFVKKLAAKTAQVVYTVGVWGAGFAWMGLVSVTWAVVRLAMPGRNTQDIIGAPGMAVCLRFTLSKVTIIYDPAFVRGRCSVFCQNHVNLMDAHAACAAIKQPFCGLMNAWQFHIPMYGWIMWLAEGIPVRSGANRYREVADAARERASRGISILTYPEAHRTRDGKVQPFKKGVFLMAREAGLPVVPLATRGMSELNRKGSWMLKPSDIQIYVGAQIETAGLSDDELRAVIERTEQIVRDFNERGLAGVLAREPGPTGPAIDA
ncbi:lysophospholipid acyltransferase family protein [Nannocystis sp.]|uniref:lysophospholipid acyltransferase family protein n=1 Tax=Nannocystis sp. TaxID=1962667 RepID=UPI0025FB2375|nr:lysophospholipid acyltransferase family protein [Nannocystis sp.]MBK7826197.1 1-acyl-sn-glycerol-3-phosphate acyltransferase [Nannocystis sp.]